MPISAPTPAAARGSDSAVLRRICSRDSCDGARVIPWPPRASSSVKSPSRSSGSGISEINSAAPRSTPRSLALRAQRPSGSRSRCSDGTTVSQTAVRTDRWESLSTRPATSPEPIGGTLPGTGRLASTREPACRDGDEECESASRYARRERGSRTVSLGQGSGDRCARAAADGARGRGPPERLGEEPRRGAIQEQDQGGQHRREEDSQPQEQGTGENEALNRNEHREADRAQAEKHRESRPRGRRPAARAIDQSSGDPSDGGQGEQESGCRRMPFGGGQCRDADLDPAERDSEEELEQQDEPDATLSERSAVLILHRPDPEVGYRKPQPQQAGTREQGDGDQGGGR